MSDEALPLRPTQYPEPVTWLNWFGWLLVLCGLGAGVGLMILPALWIFLVSMFISAIVASVFCFAAASGLCLLTDIRWNTMPEAGRREMLKYKAAH